MNKMLASLAALSAASMLVLPSPATADFFIKKTKPKVSAPTQPRPPRPPRRNRGTDPRNVPAIPDAPVSAGINPLLMQQAVTEAQYTAQLNRDPEAKTAVLQVTNGKSGWSVNFLNCMADDQCGTMEFYTLWRVSNEANVCNVWGSNIARDPSRNLGKPFCYVVPDLARQFHLKLSSDQAPYAGLGRLSADEAKTRMRGMIDLWSTSLDQLPQAWEIASSKCPKASDKCPVPKDAPVAPAAAETPAKTAARAD